MKTSLIFILLFITGCVPYKNYIPIESERYKVIGKKIVLKENEFELEVWGKNGRPDRYKQYSRFYIKIQSKLDTLELYQPVINLISLDGYRPFKLIYSSYDKYEDKKVRLISGKDYLLDIEFVLVDSSLVLPNDNIKGVHLQIDGLFKKEQKTKTNIFKFSTQQHSLTYNN